MKFNKYWVILLPLIIIVILYMVYNDSQEVDKGEDELMAFLEISDAKIDEPKTYHNKRFNFSVDYPEAWNTVSDDEEATESEDGDPQSGILIYVEDNKDDTIFIFGQNGHIGIPPHGKSEKFLTNEGVSGTIMYSCTDDSLGIDVLLGDCYGATVYVKEEIFSRNKKQILGILRSIRIEKQE